MGWVVPQGLHNTVRKGFIGCDPLMRRRSSLQRPQLTV